MHKYFLGILFYFFCVNSFAAKGSVIGPLEYQGFADSPFQGLAFDYFFLETFEDRLFNVPGVTATGNQLQIATNDVFPGAIDSVEYGTDGVTLYARANPGITFVFDKHVLGRLPTHVGIVWTDGLNNIGFQAFDSKGNLIGSVSGSHADNSFNSGTNEDRFYGAIVVGGISKIQIFGPSRGIEVDHLQYGFLSSQAVPEPTSMAIFGLGALGIAYRTRRRM